MTADTDRELRESLRRETDAQIRAVADRLKRLEEIAECAANKFDEVLKETAARDKELEKKIEHIGSVDHLEHIAASWARDKGGGLMFKFVGRVFMLLLVAVGTVYAENISAWAKALLHWKP